MSSSFVGSVTIFAATLFFTGFSPCCFSDLFDFGSTTLSFLSAGLVIDGLFAAGTGFACFGRAACLFSYLSGLELSGFEGTVGFFSCLTGCGAFRIAFVACFCLSSACFAVVSTCFRTVLSTGNFS